MGKHIYLKFESYNLMSKTWFIKLLIYVQNALKLIYEHL